MKRIILIFLIGLTGFSGMLAQEEGQQKKKRRTSAAQQEQNLEKKAMSYLDVENPEHKARLLEIKEKHPYVYKREIGAVLREKRKLERVKKRDPEKHKRLQAIQKLDRETRSLGFDYKQAESDEDKAKIKKALESALNQLFELREAERNDEISRLERQLEELKQSVKNRAKNRAQIVKTRLESLTGEDRDYRW